RLHLRVMPRGWLWATRATNTRLVQRTPTEHPRVFPTNEVTGVRNGDEIPRIEHTHTQERDGHGRLESGLAWTRGVRNERDKSTVGVLSGNADDQRGPHLRCHAEVHQPDLAPARPCHSGCSRRSSSVNRRSAAATKSSSCGKSCAAKATRRASSAASSDRSRSGSASISSSSFCVASVTKSESHFVFFGVKLGVDSEA